LISALSGCRALVLLTIYKSKIDLDDKREDRELGIKEHEVSIKEFEVKLKH